MNFAYYREIHLNTTGVDRITSTILSKTTRIPQRSLVLWSSVRLRKLREWWLILRCWAGGVRRCGLEEENVQHVAGEELK